MAESLIRPGEGGPDAPPVDRALPARARQGEPATLEEIVAAYRGRITRLVYRLLGWDDDVEDIVQDVFLAALKGLRNFRGSSSVATWLTAIAVNRCRSYRRRRLLRLRFLKGLFGRRGAREPAEGDPGARETLAAVRRAVRALPAKLREVAVLRYLEEMAIDQIADVLGLSRNAVDVRLHRARARLKETLQGLIEESKP